MLPFRISEEKQRKSNKLLLCNQKLVFEVVYDQKRNSLSVSQDTVFSRDLETFCSILANEDETDYIINSFLVKPFSLNTEQKFCRQPLRQVYIFTFEL